jgi:hypothetical protein
VSNCFRTQSSQVQLAAAALLQLVAPPCCCWSTWAHPKVSSLPTVTDCLGDCFCTLLTISLAGDPTAAVAGLSDAGGVPTLGPVAGGGDRELLAAVTGPCAQAHCFVRLINGQDGQKSSYSLKCRGCNRVLTWDATAWLAKKLRSGVLEGEVSYLFKSCAGPFWLRIQRHTVSGRHIWRHAADYTVYRVPREQCKQCLCKHGSFHSFILAQR